MEMTMLKRLGIPAAVCLGALVSQALAEPTGETATGIGTYSAGVGMGRLIKCSVRGVVANSTECQINLGKDGDVWVKKQENSDGKSVTEQMNPWAFSGSASAINVLSKYEGSYVWVDYVQDQISHGLTRDTDYTVTSVSEVTRKVPACSAVGSKTGNYSEGSVFGRIVKSSTKGTAIDSWELIIQRGESGKDFVEMSVDSKEVFECAKEWVKSGKPALVRYTQKFFTVTNNTTYSVYKIEAKNDDL
jgi:hypothetical protein